MGHTQEESEYTVLHKGNAGSLKNIPDQAYIGLVTDNHYPTWREKLFSQNLMQPLCKALATDTNSYKHAPGFREGALYQGP